VTVRLKHVLSWWFILQIVLPFTAPLQTLELRDLLGTRSPHSAPASPESTTTPTVSEVRTNTSAVGLMPAMLGPSTAVVVIHALVIQRPLTPVLSLSSSPHHQLSVLRL
jgi:predicted secreted protein